MNPAFYRDNPGYSDRLRNSDPRQFQTTPILCGSQSFYQKYIDALARNQITTAAILDVGCGVGQTVHALAALGFDAHGVDVSPSSIAHAQEHPGQFQIYDGVTLPFADASFAAVGAFNVLEHVPEPVVFLNEMDRVLRPGGAFVLSSPNFLRVLGWRDYHPHMRGVGQKIRNLRTLLAHRHLYAKDSSALRFESLAPIHRDPPQPDDDAVIATTALDLVQYLKRRGYQNIHVSCVDRPLPPVLESILDATPLRYLMLNSFVTARKT